MNPAELLQGLAAYGYQARLVKIERVAGLAAAIAGLNQQGCFSPEFYEKELAKYLNFDYASILPGAKSIVILGAFQPPTRVRFGALALTIPPTYIYRDIWEGSLKAVTGLLAPYGYQAARARLPLKTLAVRSGLGRYGRNNICYLPDFGSFHRLGAFYTDLPCEADEWAEPRALALCEKCRLCREACPTGAILPDRFLVQADRCLTYFNEHEEDFPDWVKHGWHNAVFGCMICQRVCPQDIEVLPRTQDSPLAFDDSEVALILKKTPLMELPAETQRKLHELCLDDDYNLLPRNLGCLLPQR